MKGVFDISAAISEKAASFLEETGIAPAVCCVSREIYRLLVEQNAAKYGIGNLIIATNAVTRIITDTMRLRVVIDESLSGDQLCLG